MTPMTDDDDSFGTVLFGELVHAVEDSRAAEGGALAHGRLGRVVALEQPGDPDDLALVLVDHVHELAWATQVLHKQRGEWREIKRNYLCHNNL